MIYTPLCLFFPLFRLFGLNSKVAAKCNTKPLSCKKKLNCFCAAADIYSIELDRCSKIPVPSDARKIPTFALKTSIMLAKRYFNTSGPNIPSQHYTLMRPALVAKGKDLVYRERYFTIWAPRQTGKSTYFQLLKEELQREGYVVVQMNLENYLGATFDSLMHSFKLDFGRSGLKLPVFTTFDDLSTWFKGLQDQKLVLIIDEIEGLNPDLFGQFLHTIRNLYHSRQSHSLKSVILVGVTNILGVVQDHASPFNIADNLDVPYFTDEEVWELYGQHEAETGQLFAPEVKDKICRITANQPGLVNGFAFQLVERNPGKPVIEMQDYLTVEDWYLTKAIDKNISNIINKAKQYRPFVERLLFTEDKVPFRMNKEAIKFLHTNGLLTWDEDNNVTFWVPLYKKAVYDAFYPYTNGERRHIAAELDYWNYLLPDGRLNMPKVLENYKAYVRRRSFKYFREKDEHGKYRSIKEAALVYSFETYIAAFLELVEGKSYLEPHTGTGRSDLIINVQGREYVVEAKVFRHKKQFEEGKGQLATYCRSLSLPEGWYLVFVPNHIDLERLLMTEGTKDMDGVLVHTYLVLYDEERDFG